MLSKLAEGVRSHMYLPHRSSLVLALMITPLLGASFAGPVSASTILAGYDLFTVEDGTAFIDFSADPLPTDFFAPGSDPFAGMVQLRGKPLGSHPDCPSDDLTDVDAILRRLDDAVLPGPTSTASVEVEIIAMQLRSVDPIPVTFGGSKRVQFFEIKVEVLTQPSGNFLFRATDQEGDLVRSSTQYKITPKTTDESEFPGDDSLNRWLPAETLPGWDWMFQSPPDGKSTAATCTSNVCLNPGVPGTFSTGPLAFSLVGTCAGDPVSSQETTWGGLKARYR